MNRIVAYIAMMGVVFLSGCTGLRLMPPGEVLYTGAGSKIISADKLKKTSQIKSNVQDIIRPKPNTTFLGMRPGLWLYYVAGTPKKKKGLRTWIKNKLGEPPVYLSSVDTILLQKAIEAKLYNTGFLDGYDKYSITRKHKGKTAFINYELFLKKPFTIKEVSFPSDSDALSKLIHRSAKKTLLKKGDAYNLDVLVSERARIDEALKRHGYYFFNKNFIEYLMDTVGREVTLQVRLKKDMPDKSKKIYHISEVNVYPDYTVGSDSAPAQKLIIDSVNYYKHTDYIHPRTVMRSVFFRPDSTYDSRVQHRTLARLNNLNVFKYINLDIKEADSSLGRLHVNIMLSPLPKNALTTELQAATKSNNFIGPGLTLGLRNRNAFKGAELLIFNLQGSFETQYNGIYKGLFTYQVNPHVELDIPRIISPFKVKAYTDFVPHTKFALDYSFLSRVGYFDMNSFKLDIGYKWKQSVTTEHDLTLLNVAYYNIYNRTATFDSLINSNPLIKSRFDEQFLGGIAYSFFYTQQVKTERRNRVYFNGNAEVSGNALALASKLITKKAVDAANPTKIFGVEFAQFVRLDIDFRDYVRITTNSLLAMRFIAGWGLPYGNSSTLPYAKQFFSGGAYSLRGFPANAVGPGGYIAPDSLKNIFSLQQGGEIKLEVNAEYRFPIFKFLKGAIFVDAGNTWLNRANIDALNGEFKTSEFMKQIAISTGAGLRLDLNFFVIRLDLGLPVRSPAVPESERWVISQTKLSSIVFNLAFGYPF